MNVVPRSYVFVDSVENLGRAGASPGPSSSDFAAAEVVPARKKRHGRGASSASLVVPPSPTPTPPPSQFPMSAPDPSVQAISSDQAERAPLLGSKPVPAPAAVAALSINDASPTAGVLSDDEDGWDDEVRAHSRRRDAAIVGARRH